MISLKNRANGYLTNFLYFYRYLGYRLVLTFTLSLLVGVLDGFGLAMFLPMLQMIDGEDAQSTEGLGDLEFIVSGMESIGLDFTLNSVLAVLLFFFVMKGMAKFIESYYKVIVQQIFVRSLRLQSIDRLANYRFESFVSADVGRIQNTLSGEVDRVVIAYKTYVSTLQSMVMLMVYISLAYLANPQFALLVSVGGVLSNLVFRFLYKKTKQLSKVITKNSHEYQGLLIQFVAHFKYLKATALMGAFSSRVKKSAILIEDGRKKLGLYDSILLAVREPLTILVVVGIIFIQVNYMEKGLGLIVLSLLFLYRALIFVVQVQGQWNRFLNVSGSLANMTDFQKLLLQDQDINGDKAFTGLKRGIETNKLSFDYGAGPILKNLSLKINKNEIIAFVGSSGSGKTTIINLLTGLLKAGSGEVLIDGNNIDTFKKDSYQSRVGYITQEPVIFNSDIFDNVSLWGERSAENLERFWKALKQASVSDFVSEMPLRESEMLGNNGINLSGGQKQRIAIARELYKEPDILIMDEATSALDSETERSIQESIDKLKGQFTILIIAHRLSTIRSADTVYLLNKGEIEASGSYEELLSKSTNFKKMVNLQEI